MNIEKLASIQAVVLWKFLYSLNYYAEDFLQTNSRDRLRCFSH